MYRIIVGACLRVYLDMALYLAPGKYYRSLGTSLAGRRRSAGGDLWAESESESPSPSRSRLVPLGWHDSCPLAYLPACLPAAAAAAVACLSFCTLLSGAYDGRQEQSRVHDR